MTETPNETTEILEPSPVADQPAPVSDTKEPEDKTDNFYRVKFRRTEQIFFANSRIPNLLVNEVVMLQTDHELEPAWVIGFGPRLENDRLDLKSANTIVRRANRDEVGKFERLLEREKEAFETCRQQIEKHKLDMKLIKVERYFNGSKIIFYFTAENRVDFRELVKDLVQEFRTRVEIRQIGVRHETKMIGGLGCCGRELCCSSFITNFAPVSIKMAKEQNLPLNPAKISGVCNRLLCCLTYEYDTYHDLRRGMPKLGKTITIEGTDYKVTQVNVLESSFTLVDQSNRDNHRTMTRQEWQKIMPPHESQGRGEAKGRKKGRRKPRDGQGGEGSDPHSDSE